MRSIRERLGENLRCLRKAKIDSDGRAWSIAILASEAGLSEGAIQKIETGASWPDWKTLESLAKALEVNVDQLFSNGEGMSLADAISVLNSHISSEAGFRLAKVDGNLSKTLKERFNKDLMSEKTAGIVEKANEIINSSKDIYEPKKISQSSKLD